MPDLPVVEELLEKGAQAAWDSDSPMASWEQVPPKLQAGYRSQVGAAFDAVFPGWREGIAREWLLVGTNGREWGPYERWEDADADRADSDMQKSRLVVRSAWVPVEEGTDG